MAFKSLNPFYGIIETKKFPHARTLRTSFLQKLWDAFGVVSGDKDHPGLIHYATSFLAVPIDYLVSVAWNGIESNYTIIGMGGMLLWMFAGSLQLAYYTASYAIAAGVALIASPIVGAVHLIGKYLSQDYNNDQTLQEIQGTTDFTEPSRYFMRAVPRTNVLMSLQESLNRHKLYADDIEITHVKKRRDTRYCYSFIFSKREGVEHGSNNYKFETTMPADDEAGSANRKYLSSFFRLNIGGITTYCEEADQRENRDVVDTFTSPAQ